MNTKLRAGWLAIACLCSASLLFAQKSPVNELLSRADRQYNLYSYNLAIQTYQQALEEEKSNSHALASIGDCHFHLNHPETALEWYQKAQNTNNMESDVPLRLGKALLQTGDYDGAKDQFLLYAETDEKIGRHFANLADYAIKNVKKESQWQVKNEAINTSASDFGPAFYNSGIVFNSARTDIVQKGKPVTELQGGNTNYLFVSQQISANELLQKPSFLRSEIQNNRNEGPVSFSANGHRVAFCRNKFISGTRQIAETGMNMSIYFADVEDGNWKNVKAFTFNGTNYATGFPCLSPDGNKLIFASTQPGGFGGWDLYVSNWSILGWSEPRNLGTPINSPGDEVTPFYDGKDLYFSSDWHNGFGGLDVFRTSFDSDEIGEVVNMGPGVNSPREDYGFIYNSNDKVGYLTSTRNGGRGNEDIWMVSKKRNENELAERSGNKPSIAQNPRATENANAKGVKDTGEKGPGRLHMLITDEQGFPVSKADVDLSDCYGGKGVTGDDGKFYFDELLHPIDCRVKLHKKGFHDATNTLSGFGKQNIKITMANDSREDFRGYVFDAKTQAPLRGVTIQVQLADGDFETNTDEVGLYTLNVEPGLTYLVSYNKDGYMDAIVRTKFLTTSNNRLAAVYLEKNTTEDKSATRNTAKDGYVEYNNNAKPIVYSNNPISLVYPHEVNKVSVKDKVAGYSIQLEAMPEVPSDARLRYYEPLTKLANIYVKEEDNINKIRLGIFPSLALADENLKTVLEDKAYAGSWIVEEHDAEESLILSSENIVPLAHNDLAQVGKGDNAGVSYAVQLGSFKTGRSISISDYTSLNGMGNVYSTAENGYTKVRMGVWGNLTEAEAAKAEATRRGFPNVTIVKERADDPNIRDFLISAPEPKPEIKGKAVEDPKPVVYSTTLVPTYPYYVRIAALSKPEAFDPSPIESLGRIEKRKAPNSPGMTIILLGSYVDLQAATKISQKLIKMGYPDAYVVKDENGKLIRK